MGERRSLCRSVVEAEMLVEGGGREVMAYSQAVPSKEIVEEVQDETEE